jgi:hypothetical protein
MAPRTIGGVVVRAGLHLHVKEADYRYGVGDIHIVVREALEVLTDGGEQWVELDTDQIRWDRTHTRRLVQVRVSALQRAVRPPPA